MMARKKNSPRRHGEAEEDYITGEVSADKSRLSGEEDEWAEIIQVDLDAESEPGQPGGENSIELETIDADLNAKEVMDAIGQFTEDEEVLKDFAERQRMINEGSDELLEKLREHHFQTPDLSAGDIDAAWEDSRVSGEESVGGSAPTPDQDIVEDIGEALGITYPDDEPLRTNEMLEARDRHRWELNPASEEDIEGLAGGFEDLEVDEIEADLEDELAIDALEIEDLEDEDEEDLDDDSFDYFELEDDGEDLDDYLEELLADDEE
jgi:hypothetical protein